MTTYPLPLSDDLLADVKATAAETELSQADVMRQAIRLGLPQVRRRLSREEDLSEAASDTWDKLGPAPTVNYDGIESR